MAEYIEREALIQALWDEVENGNVLGPEDTEKLIRNAPAADVAPVVRCKDCDYYEGDECVCPYIFMSDGAHLWTNPDDFCSYGERRTE